MRILKKEKGNITILFAICLVVLIFFAGIAIDFGLYYMERNDLENLCRLLREDRFTYHDSIRYAQNPGRESYNIVENTMSSNNFSGDIKVYFKEEPYPALSNSRSYKMRIQLEDKFEFIFLKLFGLGEVGVSAHVDGEENYGDGGNDVIWHPNTNVSTYNGLYSGKVGSFHNFTPGVFPNGW